MPYKIKLPTKTVIQKTLFDYPEESNMENIDLTSISGKAIFKNLFGHCLSVNEMIGAPDFINNSAVIEEILPNLDEKSKRIFAGYLAIKSDSKTVAKLTFYI